MKCDELETEQWLNYGGEPMPCYPAKDVDESIAELKKEIERCQRYHDAEAVKWLAVTAKTKAEIRTLKRALWLARAERAVAEQTIDEWRQAWILVEKICRKKAEEYK